MTLHLSPLTDREVYDRADTSDAWIARRVRAGHHEDPRYAERWAADVDENRLLHAARRQRLGLSA